ncbi:MAG: hypothetical protein B7Y43_05170 [Sphingomonas sp. 28-62-20]|uniref:hypothetical protein n=1 Tax=Sphingomonas sp. 28-62-20 TaxID=1970433 RepID=UPI000BCCF129|nr:MAG: hypothetical protein B7Y43_05170 [Sphingomonas sp. 28-62-20]
MKQPESQGDDNAPTGPVPTILEAIVRRLCLTAVYNRGLVTLAPHIMYTKHDELHIDAVAVERDGKPPRELKLGTYRLSGLGDIKLTDRSFVPIELFDPVEPRYAGVTLMMVDRA